MNCRKYIARAAVSFAFALLASYGYAQQQPILVLRDTGWANTGFQGTPPSALIMTVGVCIKAPDCNDFGGGKNNVNPLTFYPSSHTQRITITSAWGPTFDAFAGVFAQGGKVGFWVSQILSNDGLVPDDFPQISQGSGGTATLQPATAASIQVELAPFRFQKTEGGWWVAVGNNGNAPHMSIGVYGSY
jgi:hypothetical protein